MVVVVSLVAAVIVGVGLIVVFLVIISLCIIDYSSASRGLTWSKVISHSSLQLYDGSILCSPWTHCYIYTSEYHITFVNVSPILYVSPFFADLFLCPNLVNVILLTIYRRSQ